MAANRCHHCGHPLATATEGEVMDRNAEDKIIASALAYAPEVIAEIENALGKDYDALGSGCDDHDRAHVAVLLLADQNKALRRDRDRTRQAHEQFVAAMHEDHQQTLRIIVIRLLRLAFAGVIARIRHPQELTELAKFVEDRVPGLFAGRHAKLGAIGAALLREELIP